MKAHWLSNVFLSSAKAGGVAIKSLSVPVFLFVFMITHLWTCTRNLVYVHFYLNLIKVLLLKIFSPTIWNYIQLFSFVGGFLLKVIPFNLLKEQPNTLKFRFLFFFFILCCLHVRKEQIEDRKVRILKGNWWS